MDVIVIRIEHLGDVFGADLVVHRAVVVAVVEGGEVERFHCLGLPQPQRIAGADAETEDRRVIGHALDDGARDPAHAVAAQFIMARLGVAAELHVIGDFGPGDFPRVAETQPFVGGFHLPAVFDCLIEDAEFIADAIADGGHFERCQRLEITRREPPQPAVTEPRFLLLIDQTGEVEAQLRQRLAGRLDDAEIEQVVLQMRAGHELGGQIRHHPHVALGIGFQCLDALLEDPVAHAEREGGVGVVRRGGQRCPAQAAAQVVEEGLLDVRHAHAAARTGGGSKVRGWRIAGLRVGGHGLRLGWVPEHLPAGCRRLRKTHSRGAESAHLATCRHIPIGRPWHIRRGGISHGPEPLCPP